MEKIDVTKVMTVHKGEEHLAFVFNQVSDKIWSYKRAWFLKQGYHCYTYFLQNGELRSHDISQIKKTKK